MRWQVVRREVKNYFVFLASLASILLVMNATYFLHMWVYFYTELPDEIKGLTGVHVMSGAPINIHVMNLIIWSLPAIFPVRWILKFINGTKPKWGRVLIVYVVGCVLVWQLAVAADTSVWSVTVAENIGVAIILTAGYAVVRLFLLPEPKREASS